MSGRCRSAARHWFAYYGMVGSSAPMCQHAGCDAPNPRYDLDRDPMACTGVTATWCPTHGDCTCRRVPMGFAHTTGGFASVRLDVPSGPVPTLNDDGCPLHSGDSTHAST